MTEEELDKTVNEMRIMQLSQESPKEIANNWSEWLLRRINTDLNESYNKGYIITALQGYLDDIILKMEIDKDEKETSNT